ncbi:MAG TPA: hypothetical protein VGP72_15670 [Planctomycetota bacterium]|jgi:hypothetical protein
MLESYRRQMLGCFFLLFLLIGGMYAAALYLWHPSPVETGEGEAETTARPDLKPAPPKPLSAREQIRELEDKQRYDEAAALCERFLKDGPDEARKVARERLLSLLERQFDGYLRGKAYGLAQSTLAKISALGITAFGDGEAEGWKRYTSSLENMQHRWRNEQEQRMREALRAGNSLSIDALATEIQLSAPQILTSHEYLEYLISRWKEARAAGRAEEATKRLREAAEIAAGCHVRAESWGFERSPVEETLRKELSSEQLLSEGKRLLADADYVMAACYLLAFREPQNPQVPKKKDEIEAWWLERLQRKLLGYEAALGLAKEAVAGHVRWLPPDGQENRIEVLLGVICGAVRDIETFDKRTLAPQEKFRLPAEAWKAKFAAHQEKMARLLKACDYMRAESLGQQVVAQEAAEYQLHFCAEILKGDIWADVPGELRNRIEKKSKERWQQIAELRQAAATGEYTPEFPGREAMVEMHATATARHGIAMLENSPAAAYRALREVLRRAPKSSAAAEVRDALFKAIRKAREAKRFSTLYEHASVFIGELGRGIPEDIREELAGCLQAAADYYKDSAPMSRVFMLSLLADVLAGDPRGQVAADEAQKLGFEAVAKMPMEEPRIPDLMIPSTLGGYSIIGVDNATDYHLIAFYDGPEKFFARVNPYRRGSVVVKDGEYTTAVIVTAEKVRPYRAKMKYEKVYAQHRYVIATEGERNERQNFHRGDFLGDYSLLRTPPDAGAFVIEPKTGIVVRK